MRFFWVYILVVMFAGFTGQVLAGPNAGAVVSLDLIPNEGTSNQINDGILSGVNLGNGRRFTFEVFVTGVRTQLISVVVELDYDNTNYPVIADFVGNNDVFPWQNTTRVPDRVAIAKTITLLADSPYTVPESGYLLKVSYVSRIHKDDDVGIVVGIETLTLITPSGDQDVLTVSDKVVLGSVPSVKTLSGSLLDGSYIQNDDINMVGSLRYSGNEKNLALESINGLTPGISSISLGNKGGLPDGVISVGDRPPIIVYNLAITIKYDNVRSEKIEMAFPSAATQRSIYVKRIDGTYGYPKGKVLAYGRPIEFVEGKFDSDMSRWRNIYYIQSKCQRAVDCITTVDYRVLGESEYYTPKMLWEQRGGVQTVRDTVRIVQTVTVRDTLTVTRTVRDTVAVKTPTTDLNGDGIVNFADFLLFVITFGEAANG